MGIETLKPLAEQNLPQILFQGTTPEQRMLSGFALAKQHMSQIIPQGHVVNPAAAVAAQESYEKQIVERQEIVAASLANRQDLPESAALTEPAERSKEFWISTYALASEGIGAYATGYARQQVTYGLLSQADYDDGIALRTKAFSNIVAAGQAGSLAQLVAPESWYSAAMQQNAAAKTMAMSGQLAGGGKIVLGTRGTGIYAIDMTKRLVPVQQLGEPITIAIIGAAVAVAIIGVAYVAYASHTTIEKDRIQASAAFMGEMCRKAGENPELSKACAEFGSKFTTPVANQPFGLENLSKYLAWGAFGLAALYMLPLFLENLQASQTRSTIRRASY